MTNLTIQSNPDFTTNPGETRAADDRPSYESSAKRRRVQNLTNDLSFNTLLGVLPKRYLWQPEEDAALLNALRPHFNSSEKSHLNRKLSWAKIATTVNKYTRRELNGKQCRARWLYQLDPTLNRTPWSSQDYINLYRGIQAGFRWSQISKTYLPERSDNDIKNMAYSKRGQDLLAKIAKAFATTTEAETMSHQALSCTARTAEAAINWTWAHTEALEHQALPCSAAVPETVEAETMGHQTLSCTARTAEVAMNWTWAHTETLEHQALPCSASVPETVEAETMGHHDLHCSASVPELFEAETMNHHDLHCSAAIPELFETETESRATAEEASTPSLDKLLASIDKQIDEEFLSPATEEIDLLPPTENSRSVPNTYLDDEMIEFLSTTSQILAEAQRVSTSPATTPQEFELPFHTGINNTKEIDPSPSRVTCLSNSETPLNTERHSLTGLSESIENPFGLASPSSPSAHEFVPLSPNYDLDARIAHLVSGN